MTIKPHWIVAIQDAHDKNWRIVGAFTLSCNAQKWAEGYDCVPCVIFSFENEYGWYAPNEGATHFDSTLRPSVEPGPRDAFWGTAA